MPALPDASPSLSSPEANSVGPQNERPAGAGGRPSPVLRGRPGASGSDGGGAEDRGGTRQTVLQGDRRKAYVPLPPGRRREALARALAAYRRGDFFRAHELLEPAWMGTADPAERDLYQGLIKLCAALVHAVRGNPVGVAKNLRGARERLARAAPAAQLLPSFDLSALLAAIDAGLRRVDPDRPAASAIGARSFGPPTEGVPGSSAAPSWMERRRPPEPARRIGPLPVAIDPPPLPTATAVRRLSRRGAAGQRAVP
jgi:hypothetical protein